MIATRSLRAALLAAALLLAAGRERRRRADPLREDVGRREHRHQREGAAALQRVNKCPTFFEMSGYESGSDEGKTPAGHLADQTGLPFPLQTGTRAAHAVARRRPLRDRARQRARHRLLVRRVRPLQLALGARRQGGHRQVDRQAAVVQRQRRDLRPLLQRHHRACSSPPRGPQHLRAVSASGLIGDLYRDIVYPGGVTNYGFPLLWTGAIRVAYDVGGGTARRPLPGRGHERAVRGEPGRAARAPCSRTR